MVILYQNTLILILLKYIQYIHQYVFLFHQRLPLLRTNNVFPLKLYQFLHQRRIFPLLDVIFLYKGCHLLDTYIHLIKFVQIQYILQPVYYNDNQHKLIYLHQYNKNVHVLMAYFYYMNQLFLLLKDL